MSRCSYAKSFKHPELLEPATSGVSRVFTSHKQADLRTPLDVAGLSMGAGGEGAARAGSADA
jgi:hypothetical protein